MGGAPYKCTKEGGGHPFKCLQRMSAHAVFTVIRCPQSIKLTNNSVEQSHQWFQTLGLTTHNTLNGTKVTVSMV